MKFQEGFTGEYDAKAKTFTFTGKTTSGNRSKLVLPIQSEDIFMAWISACLRESGIKSGTFEGIITTNKIGLSLHPVANSLSALVLDVDVFGAQLAFAMPVQNLTPEESAAIAQHLGAALALLERSDSGAQQN